MCNIKTVIVAERTNFVYAIQLLYHLHKHNNIADKSRGWNNGVSHLSDPLYMQISYKILKANITLTQTKECACEMCMNQEQNC